jgi:hypothetical protein
MTCREEIIDAFRRLSAGDPNSTFSPQQIVDELQKRGTRYTESTIRTHVTSSMCVNAPHNHPTVYADLERVGRGLYRLRRTRP